MIRFSVGSILMALLVLPSAAFAAAAPDYGVEALMERARQAESDLDYDRAADLWLEVIARDETSPAQRLEANIRAGNIARIRGDNDEARIHYLYVLKADPDYRLPASTSPRIRNFFELIRQEVRSGGRTSSPTVEGHSGPGHASQPLDQAAPSSLADRSGAPPPPEEAWETEAEKGLGPLVIGGAAAAALGVVGIGLGGAAGLASLQAGEAALNTDVQTERIARYDERDTFVVLANVGYAAGAVMAAAGGAAIAIALAGGDE